MRLKFGNYIIVTITIVDSITITMRSMNLSH